MHSHSDCLRASRRSGFIHPGCWADGDQGIEQVILAQKVLCVLIARLTWCNENQPNQLCRFVCIQYDHILDLRRGGKPIKLDRDVCVVYHIHSLRLYTVNLNKTVLIRDAPRSRGCAPPSTTICGSKVRVTTHRASAIVHRRGLPSRRDFDCKLHIY